MQELRAFIRTGRKKKEMAQGLRIYKSIKKGTRKFIVIGCLYLGGKNEK